VMSFIRKEQIPLKKNFILTSDNCYDDEFHPSIPEILITCYGNGNGAKNTQAMY